MDPRKLFSCLEIRFASNTNFHCTNSNCHHLLYKMSKQGYNNYKSRRFVISGNMEKTLMNLKNATCLIMNNYFHMDFTALIFEFMPNGSFEKWLCSLNYFLISYKN
ncbi:hypothetical protein CUMW_134790 [Citrus unshiu]|nr:hypothetical protein CUMW_134790 [Citrus unshiu]